MKKHEYCELLGAKANKLYDIKHENLIDFLPFSWFPEL